MELKEILLPADKLSYFVDTEGRTSGLYRQWHLNGQLMLIAHYQTDHWFGERMMFTDNGQLHAHDFTTRHGLIDFIENPELYPKTEEDKVYFAMKYPAIPMIDNTDIITWEAFLANRRETHE